MESSHTPHLVLLLADMRLHSIFPGGKIPCTGQHVCELLATQTRFYTAIFRYYTNMCNNSPALIEMVTNSSPELCQIALRVTFACQKS